MVMSIKKLLPYLILSSYIGLVGFGPGSMDEPTRSTISTNSTQSTTEPSITQTLSDPVLSTQQALTTVVQEHTTCTSNPLDIVSEALWGAVSGGVGGTLTGGPGIGSAAGALGEASVAILKTVYCVVVH